MRRGQDNFLGQATLWVYHASPLVAGALLGAFWQVLVIFGLHWGIIPIGFNNLAVHGIDPDTRTYICCFICSNWCGAWRLDENER